MKTLLSHNNREIFVDNDDYELVKRWKWRVNKNGYAHHGIWINGKLKQIKLHRYILGVSDKNVDIDHINGNKLDNRRSNLRLCSRSLNMANSGSRPNSTSKYKGVGLTQNGKKWRARIMKDYKEVYHEIFDSEIEAAKAYNKIAKKVFGEFARLNEI